VAWFQRRVRLRPRARGAHLVTDEIVADWPELARLRIGLAHVFLQHTSAALTINENADPAVRSDLARWLDRTVPDGAELFAHDAEGPDDMPAHVKSSLLGCSLSIPIVGGRLALGTWQGIWLVEPRDHGGERSVVVTVTGE
jgi:secondary thiamine-phosphate synthase enzyme